MKIDNHYKKKNFIKIKPLSAVIFIILILYTLSLFIPFAWGIITSLKERGDFASNVFGWPKQIWLANYQTVFKFFFVSVPSGLTTRNILFGEMMLTSVVYTAATTFVGTIVPCITAYLVAKYPYKFGKIIVYNVVLITMILPIVGNMPAMLLVMRTLRLYNTFIGIVIMKMTFAGMPFLIFYGTFKSLSWDYAEAAFVDGASHTRIMFKIMLPMVGNIILALAILSLIGNWNDYYTPMIYLPSMPTAALGMFLYSKNYRVNSVPEQIAGTMLFILPVLVIFLLFSKKILGNITIGGLKG